MSLPEEDKFFETRGNMLNTIRHLLGGRVAEELKLDDISTGASNDLERATAIARAMITKYGFSTKLGPVSFSSNDEVFLGKDFSTRQNYSEEIASEIDIEIRHILEECYADTKDILTKHNDSFERVAQALLLIETLDGDQFEALYKGDITPEELQEKVHREQEEIKARNAREAAESKRAEEEEKARAEARMRELEEAMLGQAADQEGPVEYKEFHRYGKIKKLNDNTGAENADTETREKNNTEDGETSDHKDEQ